MTSFTRQLTMGGGTLRVGAMGKLIGWLDPLTSPVATTSTVWPCADTGIKVAAEDLFGASIPWEDRVLWLKCHELWIEG